MFVCPSDTPYQKRDPFCMITFEDFFKYPPYLFCNWFINGYGDDMGRTNYLGVSGYLGHVYVPEYDFWQGVFWNRSKIDFRDITDGASNTLLFGEIMGGERKSYLWIGAGVMGTAWGLHENPGVTEFNSYHPQVVQFCLADGSVAELSKDMDYDTYIELSAIADGMPAKVSKLSCETGANY